MAYQTQDNTLWNPGTPNWNSTFGPQGDMQRLLTSLVIADGGHFLQEWGGEIAAQALDYFA